MQVFVDYYKLLALNPSASPEEVRKHYHRLAMISHPDHGGSEAAMLRLNDAYSVLSQPTLKTKYDEVYRQYLAPPADPFHAAPSSVTRPTSPEFDFSEINVKYTLIMQLKDYLRYQLIFDLAWLALKLLYALFDLLWSLFE